MKIAVMQPYIFPYIGYFQMINAVDKFVFYDDVNFIKGGWINRNKILVSGKDFLFTVPLSKPSSFSFINETKFNKILYHTWKEKLLQTITQSYKKAPYFEQAFGVIELIFNKDYRTISDLAIESVKSTSKYLDLKTEFKISSETYCNQSFERQNRLIDICKLEGANKYINAYGGKSLYAKEDFLKDKIELQFIKSEPIIYKQFANDFIPHLSIIDLLMFKSINEINLMLNKYTLL